MGTPQISLVEYEIAIKELPFLRVPLWHSWLRTLCCHAVARVAALTWV